MSSSPYTFSDSETIDDTNSTISESDTIIQNQRQQIASTRKNRSHTIFFFRVDGDFAYCKICESNFANTNKRAYGYSRKGGNTTNLIAHLRDKHNITKDNYSEYLDEHEEPIAELANHPSTTCSPKRQELITRKVTAFIIKNVQPLFVLQNQAFQDLLLTCEPGYKIPCDKSIKQMLFLAYTWSKKQLQSLLQDTAVTVHLTTDLWTSKSRHGYLGVTATWLTADFEFQEALLSCNHLPYPHTGEVICEELFQILESWNLKSTAFTVATDNGMNMVKAVRLLKENYLDQIQHQSCVAHTLQLSVMEGLKQCKAFHRQIKSLQTFFRLPKQAERLHSAQQQNFQINLSENEYVNPLEVLTDVKTRWNSTYLAWKRILELHNFMRNVSIDLLSKSDRASQKEGEKLERLCLSPDEKIFLQKMIVTLEPFETITRKISGAKYPTLSLVVPYMYLLKNNFAPNEEENETLDTYLSLIYGSNGEEEDSDVASDDEYIPSGQSRGRGRRRGGASTSHPVESNLDDINTVEYLQPVNTEGLLQKVRAAIFLSLDELWTVPSNIMLVATFLDPRFKNFDWCNGNGKDEAKQLVQELYNAKKDFLPRNSINSIISSSDDDDDIFKALKVNKERVQDDDERNSDIFDIFPPLN
ncbi:unnamed protein product [Rhizophagus irregularis]|nr:unnamed protein product [Rhizophagus irregularis]